MGALARATQHAWTFPEAAELVGRHRAFVRVATVPAPIPDVGARASAPASADGAVIALLSATEIASALCEAPGALCVFNPAGEALRSPEVVRDALRECGARHLPPLELWANVRIFELGGTDWVVMDTIGMAQLGVGDHEACFAREQYDFEVIDAFLRDTTYSELVSHRRMVDGDAVDGPGELHGSRALAQVLPGTLATTSARPGSLPWRGQSVAAGLGSPKRGVLRWLPLDGRTPPARLA